MIQVSEIAKRLQQLVRHPPVSKAGTAAARRAVQRTNAQLIQAGAPVRVSMQGGTQHVRFSFVTQPGPSRPYSGLNPPQLLRRILNEELAQARVEVVQETKRTLAG